MKAFKFIIPFSLMFAGYANGAVRSNHSYRNMGFTQLPTVSIGGYIDFTGAYANQESGYGDETLTYSDIPNTNIAATMNNKHTDDVVFANEAALLFTVNGINDYGFKYGAVFELQANATYDSWNNDINATKSYIYGEGLFGKFEAGNELGASQKMKVGAEAIAKGAGGINGKYLNFINLPKISLNTQVEPAFIVIPQHPTAHGGFGVGFNNNYFGCDINGDGIISLECYNDNAGNNYQLLLEEMQNATKVSYYTPVMYGFQAGVSYTPDTGNRGVSGRLSSKLDTTDIDDVVEYGITYANSFYNVGISLGFTGQIGKSESKALNAATNSYEELKEDLNSMQGGGSISYFGLTLAGSYGNWSNSLYNKTTDKTGGAGGKEKGDGKYYTAGLSYEFEGFGISGTYFSSEFQDNEYTAYSVDIEYKVAKGFKPYIEYTNFDFKPSDETIKSNKGSIIMAGILINF